MRISLRTVLAACALFLVVGGVLLALAQATPWHSSEEYYEKNSELSMRPAESWEDWDAKSRDFHALQDEYRTSKWLYADLGYLSVALCVWVFGLKFMFGRRGLFLSMHDRWRIVAAFFVAYSSFWIGAVAALVQEVQRSLVPPWADSLGIPLAGITYSAPLFAAILSPVLLWPLARPRTEPKSLLYFDRAAPVSSVVVSVIYGPIGAGLVALGILSAPEVGSWAVAPSLVALGWIALNARVLAIAPRREQDVGRNSLTDQSCSK